MPSTSTPSPAKQLASFVAKFDPAHARVIRAARRHLRSLLPAANEIVYDNYNFFVIGYSPTQRPSDTIVTIAAAANGVGLAFYHGADLPDPDGLLQGSGTQNRFVRLPTAATILEPGIQRLIRSAVSLARTPLPPGGRGRLIIQSISKKQRPRRHAKRPGTTRP